MRRRQFKLEFSQSLQHRSAVNHSIGLKDTYIKSRESLIERIKAKFSPSHIPTFRKVPERTKRTISEYLAKYQTPNINRAESALKANGSVSIKDIVLLSPTKTDIRSQKLIPRHLVQQLDSTIATQRVVVGRRPLVRVHRRQAQQRSQQRSTSRRKIQKTEFQLQPWYGDNMNSTFGNNFTTK